ncbi:MAG: exosortase system-associated protein, TIGR04073 family [Methylococcaceae bacterium]|nr:exosortase system-associated protein, TIGR04073 family [Methylococcaceae bacterium]
MLTFAADSLPPLTRTVKQKSYGAQVGEKSLNGITNIGTAWLEIPKNVVKTTKETNIIYGMIGGLGMGVFNTLGRLGTGVFDLVSAPFPTDPLVSPVRAWDNFDTKTTYSVQHHLEEPTNQMPTN